MGLSTLTGNDPVKAPRGSPCIGVDVKLRVAIAEHRSNAPPLDHVLRNFQIEFTAVGRANEHQAGISLADAGIAVKRGAEIHAGPFAMDFNS